MMCIEWPCKFESDSWKEKNGMREHYKKEHPEIKRPDKYFTKEARKT